MLSTFAHGEKVVSGDGRPNCIILDEIDGATKAAIRVLISLADGTIKRKGSKKKMTLKRPIICICNDLNSPSLRPLRKVGSRNAVAWWLC